MAELRHDHGKTTPEQVERVEQEMRCIREKHAADLKKSAATVYQETDRTWVWVAWMVWDRDDTAVAGEVRSKMEGEKRVINHLSGSPNMWAEPSGAARVYRNLKGADRLEPYS